MVDSLKELKCGHIVCAGDRIFKIVKLGKVNHAYERMDLYERVKVRTAPPGFMGAN